MSLAEVIRQNVDGLVQEWEQYAAMQMPAARGLTPEELRDSARELLIAMAGDMASPQTADEQKEKSQGGQPQTGSDIILYGQQHAEVRLHQGFTLDQMVSEYRALRAAVMRQWVDNNQSTPDDVSDLIRFNESVDQCLANATEWFGRRIGTARELFLGVLGHDLRTPLGAVRMSAELLLSDETLNARSMMAAVRVVNSASSMSRMIHDLLDFTRTRLGTRLPIDPLHIELKPVLRECIEELRATHPDADLHYDCEGDLSGCWDAARMAQLLSNLVGNAIQHGVPGAPVTVWAREHAESVVLTIHNEGPPIADGMTDKIFDPLMRGVIKEAERRNHSRSLGLGLFISREIARAHGGHITVASSIEGGTLFTVTLPRTGVDDGMRLQ